MKISGETVEEFYEVLGLDLFESEDGWSGKLDKHFKAWAEEEYPEHFAEQPDDIWQLEALMKAEEEPAVIAGFINSLEPKERSLALAGMLNMLEEDDLSDEDIYATLKELAASN